MGCAENALLPSKNVSSIRESFINPEKGDVLVVAHRGDWRNAPENSLLAIELAIQMGVDIVEIDVQLTKDSIPVLMHDKTLDRTTSGNGYVENFTFGEIKKLRLKNGLGRLTNHQIPSLEEAMLAAKGRVMINLDKCYDIFSVIFPLLEKTETVDHIIMKGWHPYSKVKEDLGSFLDEIIYMPVLSLDDPMAPEKLKAFETQMKPEAYEFIFSTDTSSIIESFSRLKQDGSRVWVNALWESLCAGHDDDRALIDKNGSWGWLVNNNVDIIQTDRPEELIEYLRAKQ